MALFHYALTHIINDVAETDSEFVMSRWSNPLWRLYDWILLALGLFHGLNGLRIVMDDYIRNPKTRVITKGFTYLLVGVLFAFGTITVLTFSVD
jgi:succinate dehydrogenase / fumarate reductase membrane anchor subunit